MTTLTQAQINALRAKANAGDVVGAYADLETYGDPYGRLGKGVTNNDTWQGQIANGYAKSAAQNNPGVDMTPGSDDWEALNKELLLGHLDAYQSNNGGEPTWEQVQDYHNDKYDDAGLDADDWFPNKLLNESADPAGTWEDWQSNDGATDVFEDAIGVLGQVAGAIDPSGSYTGKMQDILDRRADVEFAKNLLKALEGMTNSGWDDLLGDLDPSSDLQDLVDFMKEVPRDAADWMGDLLDKLPTFTPSQILPDWLLPAIGIQNGGTGIWAPTGGGGGGVCPLVLDLDGDGVEVTKLGFGAGASTVYFDLDNDAFAERTAWVTGGDGMLAIDANSNGKIDNQSELFGNTSTYANGFAKLAALDSNSSGTITSADSQWSSLRVWVDTDGDGVTDTGELKTLATLGITSISLGATAQTNLFRNENSVSHTSTYTINGQTRAVEDVWFRNDQADSVSLTPVELDVRTLFLPTLKGFGNLEDLHVAMSRDATLLGLVEDFVDDWDISKFADDAWTDAAVQGILLRWAGADTLSPTATLYGIDARIYTFMEKITGQPYAPAVGLLTTQSVSGTAASSMQIAFDNVAQALKSYLILQAGGHALFEDAPVYNIATGDIEGAAILDEDAVAAFGAQAGTPGINGNDAWRNFTDFLIHMKDADEYTTAEIAMLDDAGGDFQGTWAAWASLIEGLYSRGLSLSDPNQSGILMGYKGADWLIGNAGDDLLYGRDAGDSIFGMDGNDYLDGGEGNDGLQGGNGNDEYHAGTGNNFLTDQEGGNDTYHYEGGVDTIVDVGGTDVIVFAEGITSSNISFARPLMPGADFSDTDLNILVNGQQAIRLDEFFNTNSPFRIETIRFTDNSTIDLAQIVENSVGTSGNDTINGLDLALLKDDYIIGYGGNDTLNGLLGNDHLDGRDGNDTLNGGSGADQLQGGDGNDVLNGGTGNDYLDGGFGDDTYQYVSGDGSDTIKEYNGTADIIILGSGYTSSNIVLERVGQYDLAIKSGGQTLILIDGQFESASWVIETLQYGNGATLNLLTYSHTVNGTSGNDTIYGVGLGGGDDVLNGLSGNDNILALAGNDTVSGGDGNDTLRGDAGNDILNGNAGNDYVEGGLGDDIVYYDGGLDTLIDGGGTDVIRVTLSGINSSHVSLERIGQDLKVLLNGTHAFTIDDQFTQYADYGFETITFADNSVFNLMTVSYPLNGTSGNDTLQGISGGGNPNDVINGYGGNDYLYGFGGNDSLTGGTGNDGLYGYEGDDTYYYNMGDGVDQIADAEGNDTISFGAGYVKEDFTWSKSGTSLIMTLQGTNVITVSGHFGTGEGAIEQAVFTNGTISLSSLPLIINGTTGNDSSLAGSNGSYDIINGLAGNDHLFGYAGNDTLNGGIGGDGLHGGSGNDTYTFSIGDGQDTIYEEGAGTADVIGMGAGIDASGIRFARDSGHSLFVYYGVSDRINISSQFYYESSASQGQEVETLLLADGTAYNLLGPLTYTGTTANETVYGGMGNDTLLGLDGIDTLIAKEGNDSLNGGIGNDQLQGGAGNDTYVFSAGLDSITETSGIDTLRFEAGISLEDLTFTNVSTTTLKIATSVGVDEVTLGSQRGTNADLLVENLSFSDGFSLNLAQYNAWLYATGTFNGDSNNAAGVNLTDIMIGSSGVDTIHGYDLSDTIHGRAGDDFIYGDEGDDLLHGGDGNDTLDGGNGVDTIWGGDGVDTIGGGGGNDTLYGGDGNDDLDGSTNDDRMVGGLGNDTYRYTSGSNKGNDVVQDDGGSSDKVTLGSTYVAANTSIVRVGVNDLALVYGGQNIIYIEGHFTANGTIESIRWGDTTTLDLLTYSYATNGTSSDDVLNGTILRDTITGLAGSDTINGYDGDDLIYGGDNSDTIYGGNGADTIYGDLGNDIIYGNDGNDTIYGGDNSDTIYGGNGNDTINGDGGNDTIHGEAGDDIINGTANSDTISGGQGNDTINGGDSTDTLTYAADIAGVTVNLTTGTATDGWGTTDTLSNFEHVTGSAFADTITGTTAGNTISAGSGNDTVYGDGGNDTINGEDGNDTLYGEAGSDTVNAGEGNDVVYGGANSDTLHGNSGADTLYGGDGIDQLYGEAGSDIFVFEAATAYNAIDVIKDFSLSDADKINLHDLLAEYDPLTELITDFVRITTSGANSLVEVDRDGTSSTYGFTQIATIEGVTGLTDEQALVTNGTLIAA